jgi:hypothetical protein
LSQRLEEKTAYNKEKMENYQAIKALEAEQSNLLKAHADSDFVKN